MDNFNLIEVQIKESTEVNCLLYEHNEESILLIKIVGKCSYGSRGENYGEYLYQKIGLSLLTIQPLAVLVDMQDLEYQFGDRILKLFEIFSDVQIFDEEGILTSFVLSDKNRFGLASLLRFDSENLKPPFFYNLAAAYQDLWSKYDKI